MRKPSGLSCWPVSPGDAVCSASFCMDAHYCRHPQDRKERRKYTSSVLPSGGKEALKNNRDYFVLSFGPPPLTLVKRSRVL